MNDTKPGRWWQRGVIYQIYPRSFQDSNGDGIGDLNGIAARLDHCVALGVDALWISPIFESPMADFGYDVADYCAIDPIFGSLADFDRLVAAAHGKGLRIILDFVPNHTSDQHPWFVESRASRVNAKRDWYIWREPRSDGGPPNNWLSEFGGPAWTLDAPSGEYYYHAYLKEQPDLNWRNRGGQGGDARCAAVLVRARGRRVPRRCHPPSRRGRPAEGQSTRSELASGDVAGAPPDPGLHHGSTGGSRGHCADAAGRRSLWRQGDGRQGDDRGSLSADRPDDGLLRCRPHRLPPAVQFPSDVDAVDPDGGRGPDPGL